MTSPPATVLPVAILARLPGLVPLTALTGEDSALFETLVAELDGASVAALEPSVDDIATAEEAGEAEQLDAPAENLVEMPLALGDLGQVAPLPPGSGGPFAQVADAPGAWVGNPEPDAAPPPGLEYAVSETCQVADPPAAIRDQAESAQTGLPAEPPPLVEHPTTETRQVADPPVAKRHRAESAQTGLPDALRPQPLGDAPQDPVPAPAFGPDPDRPTDQPAIPEAADDSVPTTPPEAPASKPDLGEAPRSPRPSAPEAVSMHHARPAEARASADATVRMREGQIEVILNPVELGRIAVTLGAEGDPGHLGLLVEQPETLDLIRRHSEQLVRDLRENGMPEARLDILRQDGRDGGAGRRGQRPWREDRADRAEAEPAEPVRTLSLSRLDIRL